MFSRRILTGTVLNFIKNTNGTNTVRLLTRNCLNFPSPIKQESLLEVSSQTCICHSIRHYAKGKDKKKEKAGKGKVVIDENQLSEVINVEGMKTQMLKPIEQMKNDFVKHLSLRSTAGSIESIVVDLDGKEHTLQELAQIVRKNPKTIVINMSVFPQAIPAALKAIQSSGLNLNPQQDGTTLYVPVPKVTKEHREGLTKNAKMLFVKCKDGVRDVQTKYIKQIKSKNKLSEDLSRSIEQQIIAIADGFIVEAEKILASKQNELVGKE